MNEKPRGIEVKDVKIMRDTADMKDKLDLAFTTSNEVMTELAESTGQAVPNWRAFEEAAYLSKLEQENNKNSMQAFYYSKMNDNTHKRNNK